MLKGRVIINKIIVKKYMLTKIKKFAKDWNENKQGKIFKRISLKALTMCEKCYAFYYRHSWHFKKPSYLDDYFEEDVPVHFTECPACLEQENALYDREQSYVFGNSDREFGNMVF